MIIKYIFDCVLDMYCTKFHFELIDIVGIIF